MNKRLTRIGVIGSGSQSYSEFSNPLGRWLAEQGYDLINGGGGGVMKEVAKAFSAVKNRQGLVLGVLPAEKSYDSAGLRKSYQSPQGYPNDFIDIPIRTHLHLSGNQGKKIASRNHIIVLNADIVVGLPGGPGTCSEIELSIEYGKPLVLLNLNGVWDKYKKLGAKLVQDSSGVKSFIEKILAT